MTKTTIVAIVDAKMYVSVFDASGASVGVEVAAASWTAKLVSDHDG